MKISLNWFLGEANHLKPFVCGKMVRRGLNGNLNKDEDDDVGLVYLYYFFIMSQSDYLNE